MAKKEVIEEAVEEVKGIATLDVDFGREDLNALVAKVNELVVKANAK